jgi:folate-binding protein YgfZ
MMTDIAHLPGRAVLAVDGEDRVAFLQGLVSNDVALAAPGRAVWTALLTPQGRWLADFFILSDGARLLLDVERMQADPLAQRLSRFRLRARVTLAILPEWHVAVAWNGTPDIPPGAVAAPDPRLPEAGWRILGPALPAATVPESAWHAHRIALALPDGSRDLESEKTLLLEAGFDALNGVSWTKGCYMGQELTARTRYRGLVKRRLVPVVLDGPAPRPGTPVLADGREVGTLHSVAGTHALATLRLDALSRPLAAGEARVRIAPPAWMTLPATAE